MHDRPKIGVGIIIRRGDNVVIQQRKGAHGAGTWSVPGGHLEFGETPKETAIREALEETGLHVKNPRVIGVTNDIMQSEGKHYITLFVETDYSHGELTNPEPDKIIETKWAKLEEIPAPVFLPLKNFLENNRLI
ncbi:NUDIX domain-containing protein [Candidatus Woesearchaeota archaeon]|nr:MAG: NUDIX domain-containing protein [Candidatus Woesearchaeota archaeon]